jgi:hypothetical protein
MLELQLFPHQLQDDRVRFSGRSTRVYDMNSLRLAEGDGLIGMADASKEGAILLLKTILVFFQAFFKSMAFVFSIAPSGTLNTESHFVIEQDGEVRL